MNNKNIDKLKILISKRSKEMSSINNFKELFYDFSNVRLKAIINQINNELILGGVNDVLKILYEDPYYNINKSHYAQVQLFSKSYNNDNFLSNTKNNPGVVFEGYNFSSKVNIAFINLNKNGIPFNIEPKDIYIRELTDDKILEIIIEFLELVYQ